MVICKNLLPLVGLFWKCKPRFVVLTFRQYIKLSVHSIGRLQIILKKMLNQFRLSKQL